MAGNLTLAAAVAVAAVAFHETFALLRPCLSAPLSHFQNGDVGIEINQAWKLMTLAIVVAAMAVGIFTVFIGYDIRRLRRQRGTQQDQQQQQQLQLQNV